MNDLTVSNIERQNVLNNRYAVDALQENLGFTGMLFEGEYRFTKKMVADFYEVDLSTIDRYLSQYAEELKHNGYVLSKGKQLKEFKLQFAHVINEASRTTQLGLFNFRSVLNMGMLLTESEKAKGFAQEYLTLSSRQSTQGLVVEQNLSTPEMLTFSQPPLKKIITVKTSRAQ